eukprot:4596778-Prorocentrum_lima.AAC.1
MLQKAHVYQALFTTQQQEGVDIAPRGRLPAESPAKDFNATSSANRRARMKHRFGIETKKKLYEELSSGAASSAGPLPRLHSGEG